MGNLSSSADRADNGHTSDQVSSSEKTGKPGKEWCGAALALQDRRQKNTSSQTILLGWLLSDKQFSVLESHPNEILCKRISWMVAQTIVKQLVSVVNTSI
jgi:hypothetical protein